MAETPRRSFRIPDDRYHKAQRVAQSYGEDLTTVVVEALDRYAQKGVKRVRHRRKPEAVPAAE